MTVGTPEKFEGELVLKGLRGEQMLENTISMKDDETYILSGTTQVDREYYGLKFEGPSDLAVNKEFTLDYEIAIRAKK